MRVTPLVEHGKGVEAFADTRSLGRFDLAAGADGIHSAVHRKRAEVARTASRRIASLMFAKSIAISS